MDNVWFIAALWMGLAPAASVIAIRLGVSVALAEILVGVVAGNFLGSTADRVVDHAHCDVLIVR